MMRLRLNFSILTALALVLFAGHVARAAQHYDAIYVFGDSYCDVGNLYLADGGVSPATPPYYKGRFSNGPIWVDHLAGTFKMTVKPSLAGGTDFAFGGAELLQNVPIGTSFIPSVITQVDLYLAATGGKADPNALYVLEGGGNDILGATSGSPVVLGSEIGNGLASLEMLLRHAGAKHFLISNLLNVGILPAGRANAAFDKVAVDTANSMLAKQLAIEGAIAGNVIYSPDINSLATAIGTDPSHYGFSDDPNPCLSANGSVCADPAHTLFWDTVHPTSFGHAFIAVAVEQYVHP